MAARGLAAFGDRADLAKTLLPNWSKYPPAVRGELAGVFSGKKEWARELLAAVGAKVVANGELNGTMIERMRALKDQGINQQIEKVWGKVNATPAELLALIDKMRGELNQGTASFERGRLVADGPRDKVIALLQGGRRTAPTPGPGQE